MIELLQQPWPWWTSGILIGLTVPTLLLLGNKHFGISSNLRHICAACIPAGIPFFKYDWRKESWNLFFVSGVFVGAVIAGTVLANPNPVVVNPELARSLASSGVTDYSHLVPADLFNWASLFSLRGFLLMVVGGFLVGFGTRYGGGCTSGHAIMGISTLQLPSLITTICFMVGGFLMANLIIPFILNL
jgi:uncharacterized membrane protein YedE/YeeE